jgi:hypothetical protein
MNPYVQIKGLLLEKIIGFRLGGLETNGGVPEELWQSIREEAIATVNKVGDHDFLNLNVDPDHILIQHTIHEEGKKHAYKAIIIDFALSEVRGGRSDEEWTPKKCFIDEEGPIGLRIQRRLRKTTKIGRKKMIQVFPFTYHPSDPYRQLDGFGEGPLGEFPDGMVDMTHIGRSFSEQSNAP